MKHLCMRVTLLVFLGIFALIAGLTFHFGCRDGVKTDCVDYYVERARVTGYTITNHTCTACNATVRECHQSCSKGCRTVCRDRCVQYRNFDCYDSAATVSYTTDHERQCSLPAYSNNPSYADAYGAARDTFPLGSVRTVYISKGTYTCSLEVDDEQLTSVGIAFIVLTGCVVLLWVCIEVCLICAKYNFALVNVNVHPSANSAT